MGAFILAGLVLLGTLGLSALILFGSMMSDSPSASAGAGATALWVFVCGVGLSAMIGASHWLPHIGW